MDSFEKSKKLLKDAINIDPSFIKSYLNLSNCYQSQNKLRQGLEVIKEARIIFPESDELIKREITCQLEVYNKTRKEPDLKKAINLIDNSDIESSKDIKYLSLCSMAYIVQLDPRTFRESESTAVQGKRYETTWCGFSSFENFD